MVILKHIELIENHLSDNHGDENISKMIWIMIIFMVGLVMYLLISNVFRGSISEWYTRIMDSWFGDEGPAYNGMYDSYMG